jgi:hypothetical protein
MTADISGASVQQLPSEVVLYRQNIKACALNKTVISATAVATALIAPVLVKQLRLMQPQ